MFTKISQTLNQKIKTGSKTQILRAAQVCYVALKESDGLFKPTSFRQGVLYVCASSPAAAAKANLKTAEIIKKINNSLGQDLVKKIRFRFKY